MKRLRFVYNADSGYFNAAVDALHKMLSPSTYSCNLCAITHGTFAMKAEWRRFIASLDLPVEFMHRDEYSAQAEGAEVDLPAVFLVDGNSTTTVLVDSKAIDGMKTVEDLKRVIENRLSAGTLNPSNLTHA